MATKEDHMQFFMYRVLIDYTTGFMPDGHHWRTWLLRSIWSIELYEHVSVLGLLQSYGYLKFTTEGRDYW